MMNISNKHKKISSKVLILCIDRDDDLGIKTPIRTPVIGLKNCQNAAIKLALSDPEEADANAIFAAIKTYNELIKKGKKCEICIVTGLNSGGHQSDEKIRNEIITVVNKTRSKSAIIVSDGADEMYLLPVIQELIPIISIQRIIIKHSGALEETYSVLGKYLKMLIFEKRFSKIALGVPGIIFLSWAFLGIFDLLNQAITVTLGILGLALIIRGFDLDRLTMDLPKLQLSSYVRLFSIIGGFLVIIVGTLFGLSNIVTSGAFSQIFSNPSNFFSSIPELIGLFTSTSLVFIWTGFGLFIAGGMLSNWISNKNRRVIRGAVVLFTLLFLYFPIQQFAYIMIGQGNMFTFISSLVFGLAATFLTVIFLYQRYVNYPKKRRR